MRFDEMRAMMEAGEVVFRGAGPEEMKRRDSESALLKARALFSDRSWDASSFEQRDLSQDPRPGRRAEWVSEQHGAEIEAWELPTKEWRGLPLHHTAVSAYDEDGEIEDNRWLDPGLSEGGWPLHLQSTDGPTFDAAVELLQNLGLSFDPEKVGGRR